MDPGDGVNGSKNKTVLEEQRDGIPVKKEPCEHQFAGCLLYWF